MSRHEYWALAQHCLSFCTTLSISFEFTFFVAARSASSFLKYLSRSLTSVVSFVICEVKLASVCSTSYTGSDLLSLFKTASVLVAAITDMLQYLQRLERFVTYETVWLGVLTYNFLCKKHVRIHTTSNLWVTYFMWLVNLIIFGIFLMPMT